MGNSRKARDESAVCGNLDRGVGERSSGGNSTFVGPNAGPGGTIDVGYSKSDVYPVNLGEKNAAMSKRVPLDQLAPLYGGASAQENVPGNVSPRPGGPDRSYRNPTSR